MKKYIAKLVFRITPGNEQNKEFDEQYRMIESADLAGAFFKARALGRAEEGVYPNKQSGTIAWEFIDVEDLFEMDRIADGEQIFSTTHTDNDGQSFVNYIRRKAMAIQAKNLTFA